MTKSEYQDYIQGLHWKETRKRALEYYGGICERCAVPRWLAEIAYEQDLHVHHVSYARLGREEMEDLELLCRRCHDLETFGRTEIRQIKEATCEACLSVHWNYRSSLCDVCSNDPDFTMHQRRLLMEMRRSITDSGQNGDHVFAYYALQRISALLDNEDERDQALRKALSVLCENIPPAYTCEAIDGED